MSRNKHTPTEQVVDESPIVETPTEQVVGVFVNPFAPGITYAKFADALNGKTIREYLTGQFKSEGVEFTDDDIEWLEAELNQTINKPE